MPATLRYLDFTLQYFHLMYIGIDPDVERSGVAVKHAHNGITVMTLKFFELFDYFAQHKESIKKVRIEASWLIKHNWNKKASGTAAVNARIGNMTGANHEVGKKIVEMCQYFSIPYEEVKPLTKRWKGSNGKITHEELQRVLAANNYLPTLPKRTNQEQRDACLFII